MGDFVNILYYPCLQIPIRLSDRSRFQLAVHGTTLGVSPTDRVTIATMEKRSRRAASQADAECGTEYSDPITAAITAALTEQKRYFEMMMDGQMKAFQAYVQTFVETSNTRLDAFMKDTTRELAELRASVIFSQNQLHELKDKYKNVNDRQKQDHGTLVKMTADLERIDDTTDYLENQSRRHLRVDGIKERPGETWMDTEQALRKVLEQELKMPAEQVQAINIERAHRTGGGPNADRDRTVVVKFCGFKARDAVLQAARATRPRGVYVNEDFSMRVVNRRKELLPEMKEARDRGKIAYLSFDKLVVKDRQERH